MDFTQSIYRVKWIVMVKYYDVYRTVEAYWTNPEWLGERMLFLSGPRQVGKTTLVRHKLCQDPGYFNWDNRRVRMAFRKDPDFFVSETEWICFDEIHKQPRWKDILKGIFDSHRERFRFIVTGSARLETFKRSGDSLVGRYFHTHLFPLNLPDLACNDFAPPDCAEDLVGRAIDTKEAKGLDDLLKLGGFPEPFLAGRETFARRWSAQHQDLILREDLRDLTKIVELDKIAHLMELLKPNIGNTVSFRSLGEDLECSHASIQRWISSLSKVNLIFGISPYFRKINRALKVERKWYFSNWESATTNRFENYVAASLERAVTLYRDRYGEQMQLQFIRTHDQAEVDFVITKEGEPWICIEAKEGKTEPSSALHRFTSTFNVPGVIVTKRPNILKRIPTQNGKHLYALSWSRLGPLLP